ncbi:MAG: hypothetical protein ACRDNF_00850 [Streptosporangiaceae bacterium]
MAEPSDAELDALVEQATVDAYDKYEQLASFHTMINDHLAVPFRTTVLGVEVTVTKIDLLNGLRDYRDLFLREAPAGHRHPGPAAAHPAPGWRRMDRRLPALG